jgi:hypothetical protein
MLGGGYRGLVQRLARDAGAVTLPIEDIFDTARLSLRADSYRRFLRVQTTTRADEVGRVTL